MMNRTTVVYPVHNNYLIFRASIESLFAYVGIDTLNEILIIDDCSSEKKLIDFLDYLNTLSFIKVIKAGKPADYSFHNNKQAFGKPSPTILGKNPSVGHGVAQNIGIENTETEFILFVDSDILFMPKSKSLISQLEHCMSLDEKIMNVGQLVGEPRGIKIFDKSFILTGHENQLIKVRGGWPVHILVMSRTSGWKKHKLIKMCNGGWTNENYIPSLWKNNFKTCNFDIFIDEYAVHLGYATLRHTRDIAHKQKIVYCQDGGVFLMNRGSWYGHKSIPYTTDEFLRLLDDTYKDVSFNIRKNIVI